MKPLKGREKEFNQIHSWIVQAEINEQPLAIYISGSPGTGKTATMRLVVESLGSRMCSAVINCVSVKTQSELISAVLLSQKSPLRSNMANMRQFLQNLNSPLILVLDEINHLSTRTNSVLYNVFQWPHTITSNLIVVGIANSIDLTERLLPKLKLSYPPQSLVFTPYSKECISEILIEKLSENEDHMNMDSKAIELCARKVAAMSGDLRSALHIFRQTQSTNMNTADGCREVLGVLKNVYSSPLARARLPLQPRLLLAVCLAISISKKQPLTMTSLMNSYMKACDVVKIPQLEGEDLLAAFQTLESQSFVSQGQGGKLRLQVDAATAKSVISDNAMISQISGLNL